jgi:hypothetical protein
VEGGPRLTLPARAGAGERASPTRLTSIYAKPGVRSRAAVFAARSNTRRCRAKFTCSDVSMASAPP